MIIKKLSLLLEKREFIHVATTDLSGRPNVAPKFFLKLEGNFIYLVDYVIGRTFQNLGVNPRVSLSIMDTDALIAYQVNGSVEIIDKGQLYDKITDELAARKVNLSVERIIQGVERGSRHEDFEIAIPERVVIFKVKIEDIIEIGPRGKITREKV